MRNKQSAGKPPRGLRRTMESVLPLLVLLTGIWNIYADPQKDWRPFIIVASVLSLLIIASIISLFIHKKQGDH